MSLYKLKPLSKSEFNPIAEAKAALDYYNFSKTALEALVFGSASRSDFSAESDIDVLVIFPDESTLKESQKELLKKPYSEWPFDWILKTKADFDLRSEIGGVCFIAKREGIKIL